MLPVPYKANSRFAGAGNAGEGGVGASGLAERKPRRFSAKAYTILLGEVDLCRYSNKLFSHIIYTIKIAGSCFSKSPLLRNNA